MGTITTRNAFGIVSTIEGADIVSMKKAGTGTAARNYLITGRRHK